MDAPELPAIISHRDIIDRAGGPAVVGRKIAIDANTTKAWKRTDSIPAPHWQAVADADIATLEELAAAAALRAASRPEQAAA